MENNQNDNMAQETTPEGATLLVLGDTPETETRVLVDSETGEVLGVDDNPGANAADAETYGEAVCAYLGPRLTAANARLAALEAERNVWITRINAQFDVRIKCEKNLIAFLKMQWHQPLADYARTLLAGGKSKTLKTGVLQLSFRTKPGRVEVADENAAFDYLSVVCPAAIKTTRTVLVSAVPAELKADLPAHSGLVLTPASEVFEVK